MIGVERMTMDRAEEAREGGAGVSLKILRPERILLL